MYHIFSLPKSADDHMSPSTNSNPTAEEVKLISWWFSSLMSLKTNRSIRRTRHLKSSLSSRDDRTMISKRRHLYCPKTQSIRWILLLLSAINTAGITAIPVAQNSNYLNVIIHTSSSNHTPWALLDRLKKYCLAFLQGV